MLLYPRLRSSSARVLARELAELDVESAVQRADLSHPEASPAPTGGRVVRDDELDLLATRMRDLAAESGYPTERSLADQQRFDSSAARLLLQEMSITPSEASRVEVWSFLGCVLLPDVVIWRFRGRERTTSERFTGGARGIRNALGRLWWRAHLFPEFTLVGRQVDPLVQMSEDELVQITERPGLSGSRELARLLARCFLETLEAEPHVTREALMRDATKRLRRSLAFASPEGMAADELEEFVSSALRSSLATQTDVAPTHDDEGDESVQAGGGVTDVAEALERMGLEVIDRRDTDNRLWVVGGPELSSRLDELGPVPGYFVYLAAGSRSTGKRPAWYLQVEPSYAGE